MPVTNILDGISQTPTPGLSHAAAQLETAGNTAGETTAAAQTILLTQSTGIQAQIGTFMNQQFGSAKGPVINAMDEFTTYFTKVVNFGYDLSVQAVREQFAYFLLAVATQGFAGEDATGTQMGNFQGTWRGGGFS